MKHAQALLLMEIEYQTTKKDFVEFNKLYYKNALQKRLPVVIALIFICACVFGAKPFNWETFLIGTTISTIVILGIYYFIPILRSSVGLRKVLAKEKSASEKKKLTIVDEGLLIESENKTSTWKWEGIVSLQSNELFVYIFVVDKRYLLFPKRYFSSESEVINFMGLIQSKITATNGVTNFPFNRIVKKPSYSIGLICLIPVVGAIAGVIFIVNGISKYKDKWFIIIGFSGIVFTMCISAFLFYYLNLGRVMRSGFAGNSQMQLNTLMKDIEFYKIKNGAYPDSLEQISKDDPMAWIDDPLQSGFGNSENIKFNYQKVGNHYYLFSSGIDGIPNTKDDIYPQVAPTDSAKFGLIRKSY